MISHRNSALRRVALCVLGLALAACDRATAPTQLTHSVASLDKNAAKSGVIAARVLTNKAGVSILEVRTGTFDNATNTGVPDGWFEKIKYTIVQNDLGKNGKKIFERNVNFKKSNPTLFSEVINVCKKGDEDDPPADADKKPHPPCTLQIDKSYTISIEANLKGVGGDGKANDVVRDTAVFFRNPEVDLSAEKVQEVITTNPRVTTDVLLATVDSTTTYQVRFVNSSTDIGIRTTCEVHVFNSANVDVTPARLTYRWIPNGSPAYDATRPGSAASEPTTIKPGEQAICEFSMKLSPTGSYRIEVTANAVYPDDYDPSNNTAIGTVRIITGTPVFPPPGEGFGANTNANDFAFYGAVTSNPFTPLDYRGDSAQTASIDSLSSVLIDGNGLTGSFTVKLDFSTVDSVENLPATATRSLTKATWTGNLATISALALNPSTGPCISSDAPGVGTLTTSLAANGNVVRMIMCITPVPNSPKYKISISVLWTPHDSPPLPVSKANGAVSYGDFLYFDVDLSFSAFPENPTAHAPVALSREAAILTPPQSTFGALLRLRHFK
jgi:hypothetical protein